MKKLLFASLMLIMSVAQAQKISELPTGMQPTGTELIPMVQSATTVSVTAAQLATYVLLGNATTSTALATAPSGCTGVNFAQGIGANGNAICAQPSNITGNAATATTAASATTATSATTAASATVATALAATPAQCSGSLATGIAATGTANCSNVVGSPTGGTQGSGTLNTTGLFINGVAVVTSATGCTSSSFTGTLTGITSPATATIFYTLCGNTVWLSTESNVLTGTSNSNSMTLTGVPNAILSSSDFTYGFCTGLFDNGTLADLNGIIKPSSTGSGLLTFFLDTVTGSHIESGLFTTSGTKGFDQSATCVYTIQ